MLDFLTDTRGRNQQGFAEKSENYKHNFGAGARNP